MKIHRDIPISSISMMPVPNGTAIKNALDKCMSMFAVKLPSPENHAKNHRPKVAIVVLNINPCKYNKNMPKIQPYFFEYIQCLRLLCFLFFLLVPRLIFNHKNTHSTHISCLFLYQSWNTLLFLTTIGLYQNYFFGWVGFFAPSFSFLFQD